MPVASMVGNLRVEFGHAIDLRVLELFAMYATDGRTDRRKDGRTKATLTAPSYRRAGGGIINDLHDDKVLFLIKSIGRYITEPNPIGLFSVAKRPRDALCH